MLRQATTNDATKLDELNRKVLPENYPLDFWIDHIEASPVAKYVIEEDENDTEDTKDTKKIVAYVLAVLQYDNQKRIIGHIYSIGVEMECRKKGYGKMLLDAAEKYLRKIQDIHCITLNVRKTNVGAISFYQKLDYTRVKKVKEYYGKKQDGFLMRKNF